MADDELAQLESYCEAFYCGSHADQRQAHEHLLPLVSDPSRVPQLQLILAKSQSPNALIFAASGLMKCWNKIPDQHKDDTRKFVLNYLYNNGPHILQSSPTLLQNLVRLLCRIVKFGWLESITYQNITEQVDQFLLLSASHWIVALTIYTTLTEDMQPPRLFRLARFRRTAASFREVALTDIFQIAIQTLQHLNNGAVPYNNPAEERLLLKQLLELTLNCLSFDFSGNTPDETSDEQATIMIPQSWQILKQEKILDMFFEIYRKCWLPSQNTLPRADCARLCLQCLVLFAAIRRSFFSKEEDKKLYLQQLISGTAGILESGLGLQDDHCYHELCRLLGKVNAANQLVDLSQSSSFQIWLNSVFQFTMRSLENWIHLPNSFWSNLVTPIIHLKEKTTPELVTFIRKISTMFIESRMKIAQAVAQSQVDRTDIDFEDPLSNEVMRGEQLEVIGSLSRCGYLETCQHIIDLLHDCQTAARESRISPELFQQKVSWLVYFIGTLVTAQDSHTTPTAMFLGCTTLGCLIAQNSDGMDEDDGESSSNKTHRLTGKLASMAFGLIRETDSLQNTPEGLELAYLYFLEQFRKVFIDKHARQLMKLQVTEAFLSGITDTEGVLNLIVEKLFTNLQRRTKYDSVIKRTLQIFGDSVTGLSVIHAPTRVPHFLCCGKLILKSSLVKEALMDHQNLRFEFLSNPSYGKYRTMYYNSLTKLLLMDLGEEPEARFTQFMQPFERTFSFLTTPANEYTFKQSVIWLARDLRGIASAVDTTETYNLLFDWLINNPKQPGGSRIDLLSDVVDIWWGDHTVMVPLLKFMVAFVFNKNRRINFEPHSPNGIVLFKILSKLFQIYGQKILTRTNVRDPYKEIYKGLACALEMFGHSLCGGYTNFGVFQVYSDSVLSDSLSLGLRMCLAIPEQDLQAYVKSLKPFYFFLEIVSNSFMEDVMRLDPPLLAQLLRGLEDGLCSFENTVALQSCAAVDSIVCYIFANKDKPDNIVVQNFLAAESGALKRILHLMLQLVITGEATSAWSMARPMLGLILLDEPGFHMVKEQLIMQQIPERREIFNGYFDDLMTGVEHNLQTKNKEDFTKNLYVFAQLMRASFA